MRSALRACLILLLSSFVTDSAYADVCVAIDETHDMLPASERTTAVLLVSRQFEVEGERLVDGCPSPYRLSHTTLGNTIFVTLDGPRGRRVGTALGTDDLPALYSQMVRSIVTGRPMTGFNVVDRTNVTTAQSTSGRRIPADTFWYARLGYGALFADRSYGTPALGFGYRAEMDSFGVDVSFINYQIRTSNSYSYYDGGSDEAIAGSLLKLEGLYFLNPSANKSGYVGGGLSWGHEHFGNGWNGSGLQGELTAGYELPRASTLRVFIQADAMLPFYDVAVTRYQYQYPIDFRRPPVVSTDHRYAPTFVMSVGFGWQKHRN